MATCRTLVLATQRPSCRLAFKATSSRTAHAVVPIRRLTARLASPIIPPTTGGRKRRTRCGGRHAAPLVTATVPTGGYLANEEVVAVERELAFSLSRHSPATLASASGARGSSSGLLARLPSPRAQTPQLPQRTAWPAGGVRHLGESGEHSIDDVGHGRSVTGPRQEENRGSPPEAIGITLRRSRITGGRADRSQPATPAPWRWRAPRWTGH